MNRSTFRKLAEARLLDAKALLKAKRYDAAHYLAGYVIECALKACIAKKTRLYDFPPKDTNRDFYIHELEKLVKVAGIENFFKRDRSSDAQLARYWEIVKDWKPDVIRYDLRGMVDAKTVKTFLFAIEDKQHGVLQCLSKYW